MNKSKGKGSPFPWWEKRRKAMDKKFGFSESQYIAVGNSKDKFKVGSTPVQWKEPVRDGEGAVKLSAQQEYVLNLIREGKNVFYTGNAGTGKTTLLREIQKCAPEGTFVTALTGVAAVQAGGTTLHSFAGIGLGNGTKENLYSIVLRGQKAKNWRSANVLIIDEVSMLDGKLFDKLDYIARKIRQSEKPFGGIQLVLCGDFFQLPPIQKVGETSVNYCFQSSSWGKVLDYSLELTQIYRQSDPKLIKLLNEVRYQHVSPESLELLNYLNRPLKCSDIEPTKLYSHNKSVNDINNRKLDSLEGEEKTYYASDSGQSPYKENLSKYVIAMEKLVLKKGAQVMLLKNLTEELINGSRGVVEEFDEEGWPRVKFTDGKVKTISVVDWNLENSSGIVLARRIQVPLKLAWAITIHKSQGMSIDLLQVDLKHVFSQGQAYVALSRARTIEGLQVLTFDETKFTTSDAVIKFYREKIQKAPGQLAPEPSHETSTSSSTGQIFCHKDVITTPWTTPSKRRRSEENSDNFAKKRFRPSGAGTSPIDSYESCAKHEMSYSSQSSLSSSQGESSQMESPSSPFYTPVKRGFRKASELCSDSPSQNEKFSLPFLIEEATDEECLLASPTPRSTPTQLIVKRKRLTQSRLLNPKDNETASSSNTDLKANSRQAASDKGSDARHKDYLWNKDYDDRQDGPSWNANSVGRQGSFTDSVDKQKSHSTIGVQANKTDTKAIKKKYKQRSRGTKSANSHTNSAENDEGNARLEAKVKRQKDQSKRKCSLMFDALKSGESKKDEKVEENGPFLDNQTASSKRAKSSHSTDKPASELPSAIESCFSFAEHQLTSSGIGVACERSRERSKIHCSKLFESLKEDYDEELPDPGEEQQRDASVIPYYADKNLLDVNSSVHRSTSLKLQQICKMVSKDVPVNGPERMKDVAYTGYSKSTSDKTKTAKDFQLPTSAKDKGAKSKDALTQTDSMRRSSRSDIFCVGEKEAFTQTDTFPGHPCSDCMGVQDNILSKKPDTSSRKYPDNSVELCTFSQANTYPCNLSLRKSVDLHGMYLEFRIPSTSFVIAELNKMMRVMLYMAAVMCDLSIQVFCKQFDD